MPTTEEVRAGLAEIVNEVAGVPVEDVYVDTADSDTGPHCMGSFASRGTHRVGNAVMAAATEALSWLLEARGHCASTSSVAGLRTGMVWSPATMFPSMRSLKSLMALLSPCARTSSRDLVMSNCISRLRMADHRVRWPSGSL